MKVLIVIALFVTLAVASDSYYRPGLRRGYNSIQAPYNNADRQRAVNHKAEYIGSGTGTARWEGVPGTGLDFGYGYYRGNNYGYNRGYDSYNHGYDNYNRGYDNGYYGY